MTNYGAEYIAYRLSRAHEAFRDAKLLAVNQAWNASINRLYYVCFYAASALLLKNDINNKTHNGQLSQFNLHFIKTGIIPTEYGRLYARLMDWRQKGDYGDLFDSTKETVDLVLAPVEEFLTLVTDLVK